MTRNVYQIQKIFDYAAKAACVEWGRPDLSKDLVNDLWVWHLETPAIQKRMAEDDELLAKTLVRKRAVQLLVRQALDGDIASGKALYSSEAIKDHLKGGRRNRYLSTVIVFAMENLNPGYAEAIRSRFTDGVVPEQGAESVRLTRAIRSLTEQVNVIVITAGMAGGKNAATAADEGPGTRGRVFPGARKPSGVHSDPTGDTVVLLQAHPELRDEYLAVTPIKDFLSGSG